MPLVIYIYWHLVWLKINAGIDRIRLLEKYNDLAEELIAKYTVADLGKSNPKIRGKEVKWSKEPKFDWKNALLFLSEYLDNLNGSLPIK